LAAGIHWGIPDQVPLLPINELLNEKYKFHDTILSSIIQHALHAVAIDEKRKVFDVTPMKITRERFKFGFR